MHTLRGLDAHFDRPEAHVKRGGCTLWGSVAHFEKLPVHAGYMRACTLRKFLDFSFQIAYSVLT